MQTRNGRRHEARERVFVCQVDVLDVVLNAVEVICLAQRDEARERPFARGRILSTR